MAHKAQERAQTRRTVLSGVITAFIAMAVLAAILAAGAVPARGAGSVSGWLTTLCDQQQYPQLQWSIDNGSADTVAGILYVDGAPVRTMTVPPGTMVIAMKRFETTHWVMITGNGIVLRVQQMTGCTV